MVYEVNSLSKASLLLMGASKQKEPQLNGFF